ncbi:hypothetical protein D3C74_00250 [compost metagenome]
MKLNKRYIPAVVLGIGVIVVGSLLIRQNVMWSSVDSEILSSTPAVQTSSHSSSYVDEQTNDSDSLPVLIQDEALLESIANEPDRVVFVDTRHRGVGSFENSFTTVASNGSYLRVQVDNKNASGMVLFHLKQSGAEDDIIEEVRAGTQGNLVFQLPTEPEITTDWKVYVTTNDGHEMDIQVHAAQFDAEPVEQQ